MKKFLLAAAAFVVLSAPALAETNIYKDADGVVWTIEGPAVGTWRPFPGAAKQCPSHHILAEKRKLFTGYTATRKEWANAKARDVETMHIKCITEPAAVAPPAIHQERGQIQPRQPSTTIEVKL